MFQQRNPRRFGEKRAQDSLEKDRLPRTLIYEAVAFGYHVRLFYLETDDSFFLQWSLPDGHSGNRYFINPDDVRHSFRWSVQELQAAFPGAKVTTGNARSA